MSGLAARRGFLRSLAALPLVGGAVTILGNPTAAAEPITAGLLDSYDAWLEHERRWLQYERHGNGDLAYRLSLPFGSQMAGWGEYDVIPHANGGANYHRKDSPPATSRAALVLSAVGCDWRRP